MRKLLLGLVIGIGFLLLGGTTVALVAIALLVPLLAALRFLRPNAPGLEKAPERPGLFR